VNGLNLSNVPVLADVQVIELPTGPISAAGWCKASQRTRVTRGDLIRSA
jgi:hypothetical protein